MDSCLATWRVRCACLVVVRSLLLRVCVWVDVCSRWALLWLKPPGRSAPGGCFPSPRPRQLPPPTVGEKPEFVRLVEEKRAPQGGGSDLVGRARCAFPLFIFGSSSDVGGFVFSVVRRLPLLARLIRLSLIVC